MKHGAIDQRIKRLDLLGALGAALLGGGLALLYAERIHQVAVPALLLGIVSHGYAMFQKSRLERQKGMQQPVWAGMAERLCWAMLTGLAFYVAYLLVVD